MMRTHCVLKSQTLAKSGNTGWSQPVDIRKSARLETCLFLVNTGNSTSLSVTFEIGFYQEGNEPSSFRNDGAVDTGTVTWVVPPIVTGSNANGKVNEMTEVDCHGSDCSARVVLPQAPFVHFKITENGNDTANNVSLYMSHN